MKSSRKIFIESNQLYFRQWKEEDKELFYELNSDPKVMKYFPQILSKNESDAFAEKIKYQIDRNGYGLFAVEKKHTAEFIGFIGLTDTSFKAPFTPCTEISWRLHRNFWKKGYATEGAKAILDFAFKKLGQEEIVSFTSKLNSPSIAVMKRIGIVKDPKGCFDHPEIPKGHPLRPHILYRVSRDQFFKYPEAQETSF